MIALEAISAFLGWLVVGTFANWLVGEEGDEERLSTAMAASYLWPLVLLVALLEWVSFPDERRSRAAAHDDEEDCRE